MSDIQNSLPIPHEDSTQQDKPIENSAASLIRQKIDNLYSAEPIIKQEEKEIEQFGAQSKHQKFIEQLMNSGRNLVDIQTAWHNYYQQLTDKEKKEVWNEFYANQEQSSKYYAHRKLTHKEIPKPPAPASPKHQQHQPVKKIVGNVKPTNLKDKNSQTVKEIKDHLINTITARGKLSKNHHIKSLLFGLTIGLVAVIIIMFGFFNERFIAPLVTPSKTVTDTPIIVDPVASNKVGPEQKVIIPKINVEVPVVYNVNTIDEKQIQNGLKDGVVHFALSAVPGQNGNVAIVGHSSNNIFNTGKYKFAFVLLSRLQEGDIFMLNYNGQRYTYKIYLKKIVKPNDVSVLGPTDKVATATLITCDPPGTALNRLVVIGEQINPDPLKNNASIKENIGGQKPTTVPGNSESLFHRFWTWIWD